MVASMTGFVTGGIETDKLQLKVEVRTLNHRFLDVHLRLPEGLAAVEMPLRNLVKKHISRGRVDIRLGSEPGAELPPPAVNLGLYRHYAGLLRHEKDTGSVDGHLDPVAIMTLPGVIDNNQTAAGEIDIDNFLAQLDEILSRLEEERKREGQAMWQDISSALSEIKGYAAELRNLAEEQQQAIASRFNERMSRFAETPDDSRLAAEIALLVDKAGFNEELVRLESHMHDFSACGKAEGPVGRRLEFICQEMLREVNTIAAKGAIFSVSQAAVNIKSELEKIRELIQNIE